MKEIENKMKQIYCLDEYNRKVESGGFFSLVFGLMKKTII